MEPAEFAPYICDPYAYDREAHWEWSLGLVGELAALNPTILPRFQRVASIPIASRGRVASAYGLCSFNARRIRVAYPKCKDPVRGAPVRAWSFPGLKSDVTVGGVLAHELGHWFDYQRGFPSSSPDWRSVLAREKPLTGYEPNPAEAWAEAFRLFATNPDLLAAGRPRRYEFLVARGGLKPAVRATWREVLAGAHTRYHEVAERWVRGR